DRGERAVERRELPGADLQDGQAGRGAAVLDEDTVGVEHVVPGGAEAPQRAAELLLSLEDLLGAVGGGPGPGVPPAGGVGEEHEAVRVEPFGLEDGDL